MAHPPEYRPGSADPRLNRRVPERYPQIRPTSGYADPRIVHTGPGPGAGADPYPERSAVLGARLFVVLCTVAGQLWALAVGVNAWMAGNTRVAWWTTAFQILSFAIVLGVWRLGRREDR